MIRKANTDREPTTFGSKSPDILIKNIEISVDQNHYWEESGIPPRSRLEPLARELSPVMGVLDYTSVDHKKSN